MSKKQPEALRLAGALEDGELRDTGGQVIYGWAVNSYSGPEDPTEAAAAELRRLHALNAELLDALKAAQSLIEIISPFDGEVCRMVRKAIDKAEGQP